MALGLMEWRVRARPLVVKRGRRKYAYAEVRIVLPAEYVNYEFIIKPVEDEETIDDKPNEPIRLSEVIKDSQETKPTWVSEAVDDMFAPDWVANNPWVGIIRRRGSN